MRLSLESLALIACSAYARAYLETDAYITHKNERMADPHIGNYMLNLEAVVPEEGEEAGVKKAGQDYGDKIITTKDIDNYFNLQITTKLYIGSQ